MHNVNLSVGAVLGADCYYSNNWNVASGSHSGTARLLCARCDTCEHRRWINDLSSALPRRLLRRYMAAAAHEQDTSDLINSCQHPSSLSKQLTPLSVLRDDLHVENLPTCQLENLAVRPRK
jgi:hypothetical protein